MMTDPAAPSAKPRREALAWLINGRGAAEYTDLLGKGAFGADAGIPEQPSRSLRDLLDEELGQGERASGLAGRKFPCCCRGEILFWLRRRRLASWDRFKVRPGQAPRWWRTIVTMSPHRAQRLFFELGIEAIACAITLFPPREAVACLTPLGHRLARRVVDQLAEHRSTTIPQRVREH